MLSDTCSNREKWEKLQLEKIILIRTYPNVSTLLCYSLQNTKIPLYIGGLTSALNIIFNILFVRIWKVMGLAGATMLSSWIALFFLVYMMSHSDAKINFKIEKAELKKTIFSTVMMAVGVLICKIVVEKNKEISLIIQCLLEVSTGILIYVLCMWTMKSEILCELLNKVKEK